MTEMVRPAGDDESAFLAAYDPDAYPRVAVTVDVALLTVRHGRLGVLLVQRGHHPHRGAWALPGGFVEPDEDLDAAARRELEEETGVALEEQAGHLEQLRTYGKPRRDPRMRVVSVAYLAMVPEIPTPAAGSDASHARVWAVDDLTVPGVGVSDGPPLAFDHDRILGDAVERARSKLEYTTLATAFVEEPFTLGDLRRVYEAVWGFPLHEGNFRRKVLGTPGFVEATGETAPTEGRPAQLFRRGEATHLHPPLLRPDTTGRL